MRAPVRLALAALISWAVSPAATPHSPTADECDLCSDRHAIECERCGGKGERRLPCTRCAGDRSIPCPVLVCSKGKLPCRCCRGEGRIFWQTGDEDPCKVCAKKGTQKCPFCEASGKIDCPDCQRAGKVTRPCNACLGVGAHPCPRDESPPRCVACKGGKAVPCLSCGGRGDHPTTCEACYGYERIFCGEERCTAGLLPCSACIGTGRTHLVFTDGGGRAGSSRCDKCSARGYEKCDACGSRGVVRCERPPAPEPCKHCNRGRLPCPMCQ